jgi:PRP1 splicing factor, N-terminal
LQLTTAQILLASRLASCFDYGMPLLQGPSASKPADDDAADVDDTKFDSFMGNDTGAFAFGEYDKDDKEADEVST